MASGRLISVDYEVFGRVQGVFFRKHTHKEAEKLGLVGWVKNTTHNTVTGTVQGPEEKVKIMKNWLAKTGSPRSCIQNCIFKNEGSIPESSYKEFSIDKSQDKPKHAKSKTRKATKSK